MRARDFVTESADEEAWELVGQPVPEIQAFVRQIGMAKDRQSVAKIASAIEATPDTSLPAASIPRLKNLANKPGDPEILRAIQKISGQPDADKQYATLMARRDAGEGRDRGYNVSNLMTAVRDGQYESPVLLQLPTGLYVIGGRTRLYAALALNVPIKVKIIGPQTFAKQGVAEGFLGDTYNKLKAMVLKILGKKTDASPQDTQAFQRMMSKVTAPVDKSQYARLWQEYKKDPNFYVSLPKLQDLENDQKMYAWANSISQFIMHKFPDASKEALLHVVSGLMDYALRDFQQYYKDQGLAEGQKR